MSSSDESLYSLRTKILISLIGLPFITLSILLYLSLQTYQKDKLAYIFDSVNSVTNSLAIQTSTKLLLINEQAELLLEKLNNSQKWQKGTSDKFLKFESIDAALIFNLENIKNLDEKNISKNILAYQERNKGFASQILNQKKLPNWVKEFSGDQNQIIFDKTLDFFIIGIKKNNLLMLVFCPQDVFRNTLKKPGPFALSLISKKNELLISSDGIKNISKIPFSYQYENTVKTLKNHAGEEYLISYSPISSYPLVLGAAIEKEEALSVISAIIKESLLVFFMLISLCVVVGVLISDEITSSLYEIFLATQRVTDGFFEVRIRIRKQDEVGRLAKSINIMVMEIKRLLIETKEKTRMESELKTAQLVQSTFFPEAIAKYPSCQLVGKFEPASECCGDWWFHFAHNNKVYFIIGDATGHGVPAALLTGAVRSSIDLIFKRSSVNIIEAVTLLNQAITDVFKSQIMMTFLIAEFNPEDRKLCYINASHDPAFILRNSTEPLLRQNLECLNEKLSPRLGEKYNSAYLHNEVQLQKGDRIFFYTDGILDLRNHENKKISERLFHQFLIESQAKSRSLSEFIDLFHINLKDYQNFPAEDDITFFTVEVE